VTAAGGGVGGPDREPAGALRPRLSVVIPTRRLDRALVGRIERLRARLPEAEILVVEPAGLARPGAADHGGGAATGVGGFRLLEAPLGRGPQCNGGARAARGELLFFLHDDTELPEGAAGLIASAFADPAVGAACFRLRFDSPRLLLRLYAFFSWFDSLFTTFGDQGILMRRSLFDQVGGFPDWPLFEDVELCRRLRRLVRIRKLPAAVTTSAVRFERNGAVRQQLINGWLMLRFLLGASPASLARAYERCRPR